MRSILAIIVLAVFIFFLFGFTLAQQPEWRGKIEVIDGVPCVSNPREPIYKGTVISLEDQLRIGVAFGKEEYMFQEIGAFDVDDSETIYISDWKESRIKIFDKNGVYLKTLGRKGQGPGEFERINRLQIINHNMLLVFDGNMKRLSLFNLDGDFEKTIPLQKISPLDVFITSKGDFLVKTVHLDPVSAKAAIGINLYDLDLNLIKALATDQHQDVLTPFQSYYVWGLTTNSILLGRNERYLFSIYGPRGEVRKRINRDYKPIPISAEEKKTELKNLQQPTNKDVPSHHPAYKSITTDGEKRIIVQTYEKPQHGKGYYYDVFNFEGKYLARIILEYPPRIWKKNRLYTIGEDEDGFQYFVRYTVTWKI